jgi:type II secretory ATPase GspE/PulE/Tfp pilus assembly ATPase PilB-like protein
VDGDFSATGRIQQIFEETISRRCSDIHLEPEKILRIRYRIDRYLHHAASITLYFHPLILSSLKLLAGMDIAVRHPPQDGHYT